MTTKIYIKLLKRDYYEVTLTDGTVLVQSTRIPFLDGARALLARGITGELEMWDRVRPYPRMLGDIVTAAKLTVEEHGRARFTPTRPFPEGRQRLEVASESKEVLVLLPTIPPLYSATYRGAS